ncbi:universal stress protein [Cesiribacter sp. SM1]|uniref:universal stress protein n=1 Tax=Cesiribacter sp. SM1 TaxID=2861196 RepID=UPI001CD1E437|nr:universal stress protein [Cesiribacter sp. SM1]
MFKKIAIAIAFSPRQQALIAEARRLQLRFNAAIVFIHVGDRTAEKEEQLQGYLSSAGFSAEQANIFWEEGDAVKLILSVCRKQHVDLLVAGALKKENIFRYYIGSIARKILRKADCPVMVLTEPRMNPRPYQNIAIHAGDRAEAFNAIQSGCMLGQLEGAKQVHIIKEIKMYGLTMALAGEDPEHEYSEARRTLVQDEISTVQHVINRCPECKGLRINIKIAAGKSGYELAKFARNAEADLLVMEAPKRSLNIFDRIFPHDLEYILADLPTNLLLVPGD